MGDSKEYYRRFINADYWSSGNLQKLINPSKPTSFVSLFSSEIIAPFEENYKFYERIFKEIPSVNGGLVSGFFYKNKKIKTQLEKQEE
ncbi:hypothetical protein GW931_00870 [archaeon]|nr:hypothetical protein [archaeon]PJC45301.1 MAG: hypothetical protein CO037_02180 [Candidatus Pacearchaeota archaeon CG_4_9_14_0_2_um_filter_30_8]